MNEKGGIKRKKKEELIRTIEMEINVGVDELLTEIFIVLQESFYNFHTLRECDVAGMEMYNWTKIKLYIFK